jgi:hypothetical protein
MEFLTENLVPVSIVGLILLALILYKIFSKPVTTVDPIKRQLKQQNKHAVMFGAQETIEPNDNYDKLSQIVSKAFTHKQKSVTPRYLTNLKIELSTILEKIGTYEAKSIDDFINNLGCKVTSA